MNHVDALRDVLSKSYIRPATATATATATSTATPQNNKTPSGILPTSSSSIPFCRMEVGLILRNLKELWVTALLIAAVAETRSIQKEITAIETEQQQHQQHHQQILTSCLEGALQFYHDIHNQKLDGCWRTRPLLDGRALMQSLELTNGPIVGKYMQEQVRYMLLHPASSKDACESYLKGLRLQEMA